MVPVYLKKGKTKVFNRMVQSAAEQKFDARFSAETAKAQTRAQGGGGCWR